MAELVADDRVDQYMARYDELSLKPITWTVTASDARTINQAIQGATTHVSTA